MDNSWIQTTLETRHNEIKGKTKQYHTVGTVLNKTIPHCRNSSKQNNTTLSEQF